MQAHQTLLYTTLDTVPLHSPSPMDSFPPLEVNYAEHVLAQNGIDVKLDNTPDLTN